MKILALSDTHIGAGYEHRRDALADTDAMFRQVGDLAVDCDLVLHAGDVFHRPKPAPAELHVFRRFATRLADEGIPMVALHGNGAHEAVPGQPSALELFASPLLRASRTPKIVTDFAGVAVCTLPAAPLSRLVAAAGGGDRAELAEQAIDLLLQTARDLYDEAPTDHPRILLAHWMVTGATLPNGLPVDQMGLVLPLHELERIGFDAIVLGDIHRPQVIESAPFVAIAPSFYCGSPMCMDFGEAEVEHGAWILDLESSPKFVPLDDRQFVTVSVDLQDSSDGRADSQSAKRGLARLSADGGSDEQRPGVGARTLAATDGTGEPEPRPAPDPDLAEEVSEPRVVTQGDKVGYRHVLGSDGQGWPSSGSLTSLDETDRVAAAIAAELPLTDAIVRVSYRATEEQHRRVDTDALTALLDDAGVHRVYGGIKWDPVRATRARVEGFDETLDPAAAVELWLAANEVYETAGERLHELMRRYLETVA